jgi:hypothetical protein
VRVQRWRRRSSAAVGADEEPFDVLLALFANILQMRDWIAASKPELASDAAALFHDSDNLGLARDVANGSKHMIVSRPSVDGAATVAHEYAGAGQIRHVIPRSGGRNVEGLALADVCISEIEGFMRRNGLL